MYMRAFQVAIIIIIIIIYNIGEMWLAPSPLIPKFV
jgi:hypothetical protein